MRDVRRIMESRSENIHQREPYPVECDGKMFDDESCARYQHEGLVLKTTNLDELEKRWEGMQVTVSSMKVGKRISRTAQTLLFHA